MGSLAGRQQERSRAIEEASELQLQLLLFVVLLCCCGKLVGGSSSSRNPSPSAGDRSLLLWF